MWKIYWQPYEELESNFRPLYKYIYENLDEIKIILRKYVFLEVQSNFCMFNRKINKMII